MPGPSPQRSLPPPTSRSPRRPRQGARHSGTSPPPRSFASFPRAGRSVDGPLLAPSSRSPLYRSPVPSLCAPPLPRDSTKQRPNLEGPRAAAAAGGWAFQLAPGAPSASWPPPPRPAPAPGRLGGCRVPPPASTPTRLALLPSLREPRGPGAGGRGADAAAGAAAAGRGAQPGRVAGPVCAALAAGSAGWLRGRGRGVGALPPRASLLPPAGGAGPPPGHRSGRPGEPEGGRVGAGPGSGPPPRAARGDPGNVRVPGRGDAGRRQPPPPPAPRGGPGGSQT